MKPTMGGSRDSCSGTRHSGSGTRHTVIEHIFIELFGHMQQEGVQLDAVTFVGVLNASASVVALEEGRYVH
jgi:hypothetical protein